MVFRGKPSKACQRCRERKLRCDLCTPSCSPCIRAGVECGGYRDTSTLRIANQTQSIHQKAKAKSVQLKQAKISESATSHHTIATRPRYLPGDIHHQARTLFFLYYIADFSKTWDFLSPFFDPQATPEYLALSIDAASLAFLSHQVYSSTALSLSRQKYVLALRKTNTALQSPKTASRASVLDASLLLDLFEKITNPETEINTSIAISEAIYANANRAHVNGSLALVRLRGLNRFTDVASLRALTRLVLNVIVSCVSAGDHIPQEIEDIRTHCGRFMDTSDPKWRLSGLMIEITNLVADMTKFSPNENEEDECDWAGRWLGRCVNLDSRLEELAANMPPHWEYRRIFVDECRRNARMLEDYYDIHPDRTLVQTWNVLRLTRILLCEEIITRCKNKKDERFLNLTQGARTAIHRMIADICASAPQMTDCSFAASRKLPPSDDSPNHSHTQSHYLDAYILIFALYVAAWSNYCPTLTRGWIMKELEWIAGHFGVKQAAVVCNALKRADSHKGSESNGRVGPWEVYRLLGSYAFAA